MPEITNLSGMSIVHSCFDNSLEERVEKTFQWQLCLFIYENSYNSYISRNFIKGDANKALKYWLIITNKYISDENKINGNEYNNNNNNNKKINK